MEVNYLREWVLNIRTLESFSEIDRLLVKDRQDRMPLYDIQLTSEMNYHRLW